jgi:hypothetical protein
MIEVELRQVDILIEKHIYVHNDVLRCGIFPKP